MLSNIYVLRHLPLIALTFEMLQNVSVSLKEMMHDIYKKMILHTNKKNVKFDLVKCDNTLQGLHYIIDNDYDTRFPDDSDNYIRSIIKNNHLMCLLEGWYISTLVHYKTSLEEYDTDDQK